MGKQIMKHVYTSINSDIKLIKVYLNMEQYLPFEKKKVNKRIMFDNITYKVK